MINKIRSRRVAVGGTVLAGAFALAGVAGAAAVRFSDYTPLTASAGPTADEAMPITFGNPAFQQRSVADRTTQLVPRPATLGVVRPPLGWRDLFSFGDG